MAPSKEIGPCQKKLREGYYDPIIRAIALFFAIPTLVLFAIDLNGYEENSASHHVRHRQSLILDAIALAFVCVTVLWDFLYLTISRYRKMPALPLALMDLLLSTALLALADATLSTRTSPKLCFQPIGECSASVQSIMQAAGALLIIASIPHHVLWGIACHAHIARCRREKKEKKAACSNATSTNPEVISFSNDLLPKESMMDTDAAVLQHDALPFSNEIK